eukprot:NODE_12_length_45166_cov_0.552511.p18 type:complete len:140 gc:universal NODE_12_length_45166_cov_0.552511:33490-33071(-)
MKHDLNLNNFGHLQSSSASSQSRNIFYYIHDEDVLSFISSMRKLQSCRIRIKEGLLIDTDYADTINDPNDYIYLDCDVFSTPTGYKIHFSSVSIYFQVLLFFHTSLECMIAILKLIYTIGYISMDLFKSYFGSESLHVK